ncbi:MAG: type II toxin-antitoxin system RelE/ParE family toxin [Desulfuromonadaceae bacterium]|nr:type II toxin-antitoxin system RelE/ParE family toxin [Desulfuromonadaceae bacterium]
MIKSFRDKETSIVFNGEVSRKFPPNIQDRAQNKLWLLNAATSLQDLKIPPSNRLHKLEDDRKGQWSISINDQWRICFNWRGRDTYNVEITDYH